MRPPCMLLLREPGGVLIDEARLSSEGGGSGSGSGAASAAAWAEAAGSGMGAPRLQVSWSSPGVSWRLPSVLLLPFARPDLGFHAMDRWGLPLSGSAKGPLSPCGKGEWVEFEG